MLMICWEDSMHIWIKFRTFRDVFKASVQCCGDSKRIFKKQKRSGRVASTMHW